MEGDNLSEPDQRLNFANGRIPTLARANVIARFEEVRRVEAKGQSFWVRDLVIDRRYMRDSVPETTSLARGILQSNAHWRRFRRAENFVESGNNLLQAGLVA